jgi:hypothetical protein
LSFTEPNEGEASFKGNGVRVLLKGIDIPHAAILLRIFYFLVGEAGVLLSSDCKKFYMIVRVYGYTPLAITFQCLQLATTILIDYWFKKVSVELADISSSVCFSSPYKQQFGCHKAHFCH